MDVIYTGPPTKCDLCHQPITTEFVDGATRRGPWGNMCPTCFPVYGIGLGTGKGQKYRKDANGNYVKVEG